MSSYLLDETPYFAEDTEAARLVRAEAVAAVQRAYLGAVRAGGAILHLTSDGDGTVRVETGASVGDLREMLGDADRFLRLSPAAGEIDCDCMAETDSVHRELSFVPGQRMLDGRRQVLLPARPPRPENLEAWLDHTPGAPGWREILQAVAAPFTAELLRSETVYRIPLAVPLVAHERPRSLWRQALAQLVRAPGCVLVTVSAPVLGPPERLYAEACLAHYLVSTDGRVAEADGPGVELARAVRVGGRLARATVKLRADRPENRTALARAVLDDLCRTGLVFGPVHRQLEEWDRAPAADHPARSWPLLYRLEEAAGLVMPPISLTDALPGLRSFTPSALGAALARPPQGRTVDLGALGPDGGARLGTSFDNLARHVLVTGDAGSGKTTTLLHLAGQAAQAVPVLAVDPANTALRPLVDRPDGRLWDFATPATFLRFNPFLPPPGVTVYEHAPTVAAMLTSMMAMGLLGSQLVQGFVMHLYLDLHRPRCRSCAGGANGVLHLMELDGAQLRAVPEQVPVLADLRLYWAERRKSLAQGGNWTANLVSGFDLWLDALAVSAMSVVLAPDDPLAGVEQVLDGHHLIELRRLGHDTERDALMVFLLGSLVRATQAEERTGPPARVRRLGVIDEAHRIAGRTARPSGDGVLDGAAWLSTAVSRMVAECRASGLGLLFAEQSVGMLNEDVVRNTSTTVVHKVGDGLDRRALIERLELAETVGRDIATLQPGEAVVRTPELDRPVRIRVSGGASTPVFRSGIALDPGGHG